MVTWGNVIEIIKETFNVNQTDLGEYWGYDKGSISRMVWGKEQPTKAADETYSKIFDPSTNSPARILRNPKSCLEALKDTIEDKHIFLDVRKAIDDIWHETDYRKFVFILLSRAKKGPSSKIKPKETETENSNDNGEDAATFDSTSNEILDTKSEKAPPKEMPSDQMREIFAEAVAKYNVASCICSLSYFLKSGPNYDLHIDCFIEVIQDDLLSKFINYQNECVYKEISQFIIALESYMDSISFFDPTISAFYGNMLKPDECSATLDRVDKDYNELKSSSIDGKPVDNTPNNLSSLDLGFKLGQLDCIRSALRAYNRLDELYSKIFPGMTLLVF